MTRKSSVRFPTGEIVIESAVWDATPVLEPDPGWRFTDAAGHSHRWTDEKHLTFEARYGETYIDEDGEEYRESWWACKECGEKLKAGMRPPRTKRWEEYERYWSGWFNGPRSIGTCGKQVALPEDVFTGYSGQIVLCSQEQLDADGATYRYEFQGVGELKQVATRRPKTLVR